MSTAQPADTHSHAPRRTPHRRHLAAILLKWTCIVLVWFGIAGAVLLLWFLRDVPNPNSAFQAVRRPTLLVQDSAGHALAAYGDVVGTPIHLPDLPPYVPAAVIAVEDRRFWQHGALDLIGIGRASIVNLAAGRVVQGGSTIAQQVAKTLFLSNARTVRRKIQELALTLWLTGRFTKPQILEIWLNRVYFGNGAYGIDAASRLYFGLPATRLALWQAALLAGLPRAPARFNPLANPSAAIARARQVLAAMQTAGSINAAQRHAAESLITIPPPHTAGGGWLADWAAASATASLPPGTDAILRTTLDPQTQSLTENALQALLAGPGQPAHARQGAVVVLDAATGAVRAMDGGRTYTPGAFNRATAARRQPGSAFKPFVWLAALRHGVTPDDPVEDSPLRIGHYQPHDFEHHYLGRITVERALALSVNTASIRLLRRAGGPRQVAATAASLGLTATLPNDDTLALGTGSVGILNLAGAYAPFCNGGNKVAPYAVQSIASGAKTWVTQPNPAPALTSTEVAEMDRMLTAVVTYGTGTAAALPGHNVLGKTGTSQDFRDAWFVGCRDHRTLIAIWLGNDDNSPMDGVLGGTLPAQLFHTLGAALP